MIAKEHKLYPPPPPLFPFFFLVDGSPPVKVIHSLHKHWVARPTARILAGELQPLPTGGVVGVCQKGTLVLVREACLVNATLAVTQCCCGETVPVGVGVTAFISCDGQSAVQAILCCSVVWTPASP